MCAQRWPKPIRFIFRESFLAYLSVQEALGTRVPWEFNRRITRKSTRDSYNTRQQFILFIVNHFLPICLFRKLGVRECHGSSTGESPENQPGSPATPDNTTDNVHSVPHAGHLTAGLLPATGPHKLFTAPLDRLSNRY